MYVLFWHNQLIEFDGHLALHEIREVPHLFIKLAFCIQLLRLFLLYILKFHLILYVLFLFSPPVILFFEHFHFFCKHLRKQVLRGSSLTYLLGLFHLMKNIVLVFLVLIFLLLHFTFILLLVIIHLVNSH